MPWQTTRSKTSMKLDESGALAASDFFAGRFIHALCSER